MADTRRSPNHVTVGELRRWISSLPDSAKVAITLGPEVLHVDEAWTANKYLPDRAERIFRITLVRGCEHMEGVSGLGCDCETSK